MWVVSWWYIVQFVKHKIITMDSNGRDKSFLEISRGGLYTNFLSSQHPSHLHPVGENFDELGVAKLSSTLYSGEIPIVAPTTGQIVFRLHFSRLSYTYLECLAWYRRHMAKGRKSELVQRIGHFWC